jgi:integrative and conjugative element protein (TIGR02256 family)
MSLLRRRLKTKTTVWLPQWAEATMLNKAAGRAPDETGGILLGYEIPEQSAVVITHLIAAGPAARYGRGLFEPDGSWQQREVARIYAESGRRATYLGDWHSHPDGIAGPSKKDHNTARAIGRHRPARMRWPLMLIVASDGDLWQIGAFRLGGRKLRSAHTKLYAPEAPCSRTPAANASTQSEWGTAPPAPRHHSAST